MRALIKKIRQLLKVKRFRKIWYRSISATAAIVVFVTTYALVLPAITMESEASCGIPAHQHSTDCYEEQLICGLEESEGHHHTDDCYTVTKKLTCTIPEHQHDESCFDENGNLTCSQAEHTHDSTCYEEHRELTCGLEESEGHHHDSSCYKQVLTCGLEAHIHSAECYKEDSKAVTASTSAPASEDSATAVAATAASTSVPVEIDDSDNSSDESNTYSSSSDAFSEKSDTSFDVADTSDKSDITDTNDTPDPSEADSVEDKTDNDDAGQTMTFEESDPASPASDSDEPNPESESSSTAATTDVLLEPVEQENLSDGYVPTLNPVNMDQILDRQTGFYYYHAEEGQDLPASSAEITSWKKVEDNTELAPADLVKAYFAYTIPAGTLNETNQIARYRLPANLHLTDDQIMAINQQENGIAASYIDYDTLQILDTDNYHKYLGAEAIEGTRTPDQTLTEGTQEYISAVVKAENVYDDEGIYGEKGAYLGQDLIFIFTPYTIEKNQNEYDQDGQPVKAGEKIAGWVACDFNTAQIEWVENGSAEPTEETTADSETGAVVRRAEKTAEVVFVEKDTEAGTEEISQELTMVEETVEELAADDHSVENASDAAVEAATEYAAPGSTDANATVDDQTDGTDVAGDASTATTEATAEEAVADANSTAGNTKDDEAPEYTFGTLTASGETYRITLDYTADAEIPSDAKLNVREITAVSDPEAYEACLEQAKQSVGADNDEKTTVDETATRFFDIEIQATTVDDDGQKKTEKIEPKASVSVNIQLIETAETVKTAKTVAEMAKENHTQGTTVADPTVLHFAGDGVETIEARTIESTTGMTSAAEDDQNQDAQNSTVDTASGATEGTAIQFETSSFSIYGVVYTSTITTTYITASGETYEITVTYDEDAQIPDGAELNVREILPEDEEYKELYEEASHKASEDAENQGIEIPVVTGARLFDIEIHGKEGKVEPQAPVQVDIRLEGEKPEFLSVVHFAEEGAEVMELHDAAAEKKSADAVKENSEGDQGGLSKEVSFAAESFSVYTVVDVNSSNLATDGPYILVSGIQGDPGADVGYSESWGKDFFTKIVNGMAMTNETRENGLSSIGVHVWTEGTQGFVGGEATQWTFEQESDGRYYIKDSSGQYLKWSSYTTTNWAGGQDTHYDGMSLTGNRSEATQFTVTRTGANDGSVYLTFTYQGATWYLHNNQYSGANEWSSRNYMVKQNPSNDEKNSSAYRFKLCKQSNDYDSFAATKVSSEQVTTDANYVIYHKFEDEAGNEELYALAHDGSFVRVYDGGDRIYWRETDKNIYWNYQSENGHHLFSVDPDTHETVYLNPVASGDGQTMSSTDDYLTLIGKENGEYGTTIERWDQVSYDYAGLHVVKNGNTVQLVPGTRNAGTSDEFLFAVVSTMPSWKTKEPVPTVDSDSLGIKITMFDYGDPEGSYAAGDKLPEMTAIAGSDAYTPHAAHALVKPYLVDGLPANNSGNAMTGLFDHGGAITNTITDVNHLFLQTYYDENGTFRYRSEDNYAYIPLNGTTGTTTNDFTVYSQVATPYTTDRQVGHAYYYHGHFMPFNDIDMKNHLSRLLDQYGTQEIPLEDGRTYEDVYGITGTPNYYTGMKMEASFVQPSNGVLENGDDMVFKFTGDDDMWVYIDGILVLDIGGIHEPLSGTINFRTGEVTNPDGSSLAGKKTLYEIFMAVANDPNTPEAVREKINAIEWNGGTFADFTTHSFGAFYMERGAGASNLDLQFNLKIAKTDEFVVRKELPEGVDDRFVNQRFKYQATYTDPKEADETKKVKPLYPGAKDKGNEDVCLSVTYKDRRDPVTGQPITVNVPVDQNGYFYLFPGEAAVFKVANETIEYDIKEVTIDQNLIKQVDINSSKNVTVADDTDVPANGKIAEAGFAKVINRGEVVYTNHPQTQNLRITKHLSSDSAPLLEGENPVFEFRVYLESPVTDSQGNGQVDQSGKPVTKLIPYSYGPYYLVKDGEYYTLTGENNAPVRQGTSPVICSTTGRSGSINSIPPEFTIVIPDLAAGTHFYLEERRDNIPKGYEFVKEELTANTYDPEVLYSGNPDAEVIHRILARDEDDYQDFDPSTIGRIKNGQDAESHVYNRKPTIDIPVEKVWQPANNTPDSVSLALVRFKAPDQNQHQTQDGKGAILIHHYADYGNGNETLPSGFHAKYTIKKKSTEEVVFSGTEDRTYDLDPGEYTVITTVSNWGNVPSNFSPDESGSTHTADVTVEADQSTTAVFKSKYNIVADGTISISHTASYMGGSLSESTALPEGFRATYSIKDNATGKYVYTNVPASDYTVAPGTYTVTAQVSSIAAPLNYYYQRTTSSENVEVTSSNTTPVTLTSSYEYREAPPVNGTIQFSHVSAGLPGTTNLPQGFQANVVIKGPTKTIENAVAGTAYDVPPGEYQIYVEIVHQSGTLPEGYFYMKTDPITVEVASGQPAAGTLTSTFGQGGYLTIKHESTGINGTSPNMPNDFKARYTITNQTTGKVVNEYAEANKEYSVPPGEYIIEMVEIYNPGQLQNYNIASTNTATVNVGSDERKTATVTSTYERVGGNNTEVYLCVGYSPNDNGTHITVPINSEVTLKYHGFYYAAWGQEVNPDWALNYWDGYSWKPVNGTEGGVPGNQGVDILVGEEGKYCIWINTDSNFANDLEATIVPKSGSANSSVNTSNQYFVFGDSTVNAVGFMGITEEKLEATDAHSSIGKSHSILKKLFSPVEVYASEPDPPTAKTTAISVTDMTSSELQALSIPETFVVPNTYSLDTSFGKMLTLTDPWEYTFKNLPEYDKDGNEYYYAIIETNVPADYEVSYSPQMPVKASDIRANMLARAAAQAAGTEIPELVTLKAINTRNIASGSLKITKAVTVNDDPNTTSTLTNGTYEFSISGVAGTATAGESHTVKITFAAGRATKYQINNEAEVAVTTASNNTWAVTVPGLPVGDYVVTETGTGNLLLKTVTGGKNDGNVSSKTITVTVAEVEEGSDPAPAAQAVFTNNMDTVNVQVHKVWADNNNSKGNRPTSLGVKLSNGTRVTLDNSNNWSATISGLPKYDSTGAEINYSWTEDTVDDGYVLISTSEDDETQNGITTHITTLTNGPDEHYNPPTTFSGTKTWDDDGENRPAYIDVILYKGEGENKTEVDRQRINAVVGSNTWSYEFTNKPIFDDQGNVIVYSIGEELPAEYTGNYTMTLNNGTSAAPAYTRDPERDSVAIYTPNNEMEISAGVDLGFVVIKHGNDFIIWTPRKATEQEITLIKSKVHGAATGNNDFSQIESFTPLTYWGVPSDKIQKGNTKASIFMDGETVKIDFGDKNWSAVAIGKIAYNYTPGRADIINTQKITDFEFHKKWVDMSSQEIAWDKDIVVTVERNKADGTKDTTFSLAYSLPVSSITNGAEIASQADDTNNTTNDPKLKVSVTTESGVQKYSFELKNLAYGDTDGKYTYYVTETNAKLEGYYEPTYTSASVPTGGSHALDDGTIINQQEGGAELPSTGGPGTRGIYILGSILALVGGLLLLIGRNRLKS